MSLLLVSFRLCSTWGCAWPTAPGPHPCPRAWPTCRMTPQPSAATSTRCCPQISSLWGQRAPRPTLSTSTWTCCSSCCLRWEVTTSICLCVSINTKMFASHLNDWLWRTNHTSAVAVQRIMLLCMCILFTQAWATVHQTGIFLPYTGLLLL